MLLLVSPAAFSADEYRAGNYYTVPPVYSSGGAVYSSSMGSVTAAPARRPIVAGQVRSVSPMYSIVPSCLVCQPSVKVVAHGVAENPVSFAGFAFTSAASNNFVVNHESMIRVGHGVRSAGLPVTVGGIRLTPDAGFQFESLEPTAEILAKDFGDAAQIGVPQSTDSLAIDAAVSPTTTVNAVAEFDSKTPSDSLAEDTTTAEETQHATTAIPDQTPEKQLAESVAGSPVGSPSDSTSNEEKQVDVSVTVSVNSESPAETKSTGKNKSKRTNKKKSESTSEKKKRDKNDEKLSPVLAWNMSGLKLPKSADCASSSEIVSHDSIRIDDTNGLDLRNGWVSFPSASKKVHEAIVKAEKFSIVARVFCDNDKQKGPARIITNSKDTAERNFTLGQDGKKFVFRVRTSKGDENGTKHETSFGQVKPGKQQDVVVVYDGHRLRCFVDGKEVEQKKFSADFESWKRYPVSAGSEATGERDWSGRIVSLLVLPTADPKQALSLLDGSQK